MFAEEVEGAEMDGVLKMGGSSSWDILEKVDL